MMKPKKPMMGPSTKKEAKKAAPKVPMTPARTAEMKKQKRKDAMIQIGAGVGTVVGALIDSKKAGDKTRKFGGVKKTK
jgi:hypothetical protein